MYKKMNNIIKQQLENCNIQFDCDDTEIIIPKINSSDDIEIQLNHCYLIKLENYILYPPANFTLQDNWNNGIIPKSEYLNCCVTRIMGKMIKIDGRGYDNDNNKVKDDSYLGLWLPQKSFKIIKEIH